VMNSKLMRFRQINYSPYNSNSLTKAEKKWLNKGYSTPLYIMPPHQLIQYLTKQFERKGKPVNVENAEEKAKAVGFMTWAGKK
jgi:hypothetical protein